jgi:HAE1 family hydrophobic/amphiphilic exporter-1
VASRYREDDKQIEILVRAEEGQRNTVQSAQNLLLNVPVQDATQRPNAQAYVSSQETRSDIGSGRTAEPAAPVRTTTATQPHAVPIRIGSIADVVIDRGPSEVRRIRSQRAAVVSANLSGRDLTTVSDDIRAELQRLRAQVLGDITIQLAGQNEELSTSYNSLLFALGLAVFLVYLVMASEFESFVHPFIILFSVPFALVGVVFALAVTQTTVSVMVLLGLIILIGIVVNNAIVLIDYTNQLRTEGYSKREALKVAGEVRLRPILMTMLTSVLGLVPMALGWGKGAEIRSPMAVTVIGGLVFSTMLTLIFIPVVYEILDRKRYPGDATVPSADVDQGGFIKGMPGPAAESVPGD